MQKKILLLSTGGTIASVVSEAGLVPKESGEQLINMLGNYLMILLSRIFSNLIHLIFSLKNGN